MKLGVFEKLFDHFLAHTKTNANVRVLLLLDSHLRHAKNLNVKIKARENFVTIICLPPHTSYKLQPLDVGVMYPLSHSYEKGLKKCLTNHPGHVITDYQVSTIFCEAYLMACHPKNAIKGFQNKGIHQYNPDIFPKTTEENSGNGDPDDPMRMERLTHTPESESHKLPPSSTVVCSLDKNHRAHTKTVGPQPLMAMSFVKLGLPATLHYTSTAATPYTFNSPSLDIQPETASIETPMQKSMSPPPKSLLPVDDFSTHGNSRVGGTLSCSPYDIQPLTKITGPRAAASEAKKRGTHHGEKAKKEWNTCSFDKHTIQEDTRRINQCSKRKKKKRKKEERPKHRRTEVTNQPINIKTEKENIITEKSKRMIEVTKTSLKSSEDDDCPCLFCGELYKASMDGEGWSRCYVCHK
ncbi:hypothetical protein PR048_015679 [Dryococelus australis]|uniref:DDE-1 domain-containing protein n=1 Tax=Dryococelus australis TaxID=614101 RepID=A0ABQ9HHW5_9NEOP|nr:hypothetical protein PR048_015679 [Dryococelus australis]